MNKFEGLRNVGIAAAIGLSGAIAHNTEVQASKVRVFPQTGDVTAALGTSGIINADPKHITVIDGAQFVKPKNGPQVDLTTGDRLVGNIAAITGPSTFVQFDFGRGSDKKSISSHPIADISLGLPEDPTGKTVSTGDLKLTNDVRGMLTNPVNCQGAKGEAGPCKEAVVTVFDTKGVKSQEVFVKGNKTGFINMNNVSVVRVNGAPIMNK
jgi:hypothetical protein